MEMEAGMVGKNDFMDIPQDRLRPQILQPMRHQKTACQQALTPS